MPAVGTQAHVVHRVEDPALHRLEAVAGVGQGAGVDDRVGVLQEAGAHLVADVDVDDVLLEVLREVVLVRRAMARFSPTGPANPARARRSPADPVHFTRDRTGHRRVAGRPGTTRSTGRPTSCCATAGRRTCGRSAPRTPRASSTFYAQVSDESKYFRFFAPMPTLSERDVQPVHPRRPPRPGRVRADRGREDHRGRPLRRRSSDGPRPRSPSSSRTRTRAAASASCCSSTSPRPAASAASTRFVAEVLPDNRRMIQVFRDAGLPGRGRLGGRRDAPRVRHRPHRHRDRRDARHASTAPRRLDRSASSTPRSVAVIGASRRSDTIGAALVRNLVLGDYTGRVYVVNPAADAVAGHAGVPDRGRHPRRRRRRDRRGAGRGGAGRRARLRRQGRARADRDLQRLRRDRRGGPPAAAQAGRAGPLLRPAADRPQLPRRDQHRPRGLAERLAVAGDAAARPGRVLLPVRCARARRSWRRSRGRGLGLSTFVSAGNRADVSGNDLLQYWEEDDATEVVLLYLESIGNPRKFSRIARRVSRRKPIIAVRSGRTTQGVPMGHAVRHDRGAAGRRSTRCSGRPG